MKSAAQIKHEHLCSPPAGKLDGCDDCGCDIPAGQPVYSFDDDSAVHPSLRQMFIGPCCVDKHIARHQQ